MPKIICIPGRAGEQKPPENLDSSYNVRYVEDSSEALRLIREQEYDGVLFHDYRGKRCSAIENAAMIDLMPDGIALLDNQNRIIRANKRLIEWFENKDPVGLSFYEAFGHPTILGPEPSPLATAAAKAIPAVSTIEVGDRYLRLSVVPVVDADGQSNELIVSVVDCTESVHQRQKLKALHQAGTALADLRPEEIYQMNVQDRIDLLKDNILHYTKDLLNFDVVEIRLVDQKTKLLTPLLSVGIDSSEAKRPLYAREQDNGVTGFVVATGKSYLCEDTTNDPLYMDGLIGAKSSLTVPLIYQDVVIGSFNVESPEVSAFTESDLQFLESFATDIAVALNTLELLSAQQTNTAWESVDKIRAAVALPIDQILNDAVLAIDNYSGDDPDIKRRLQDILLNAREIKLIIHNVGSELGVTEKVPPGMQTDIRPKLRDKRVLVIDADKEIRTAAHAMLERLGCVVETAHEGREAILMIRNTERPYDAIIADIRLPDIGGYDLLMKLQEFVEDPPLILMTGFGYDPGHAIVKARQAGLHPNAVLFKPFKVQQVIDTVEMAVEGAETASS